MSISMRAVFHGQEGEVLSLRQFLANHPEVVKLSLREAHRRAIAEKEASIFQTYSLADGQQTHGQVVKKVINGLPIERFIPAFTPQGVEVNAEARRINDGRKRLKVILEAGPESVPQHSLAAFLQRFEAVYTGMRDREFDDALGTLKELEDIHLMVAEGLEAALKTTRVPWLSFENPAEPRSHFLEGYKGPNIPLQFRELLGGGTEFQFRLRLLQAECHFGLREFDKALDLYTSALQDLPALTSDRRKFLVIRSAFAHLALGDSLFRKFRTPNEGVRNRIRAKYDASLGLVQDAGISPANPLRHQIEAYASQQKAKLDKRLNFLGLWDGFVPVQRYSSLQQIAEEQIAAAKESATRFQQFLDSAEALIGQTFDLEAEKEAEAANQKITALQVANASLSEGKINEQIDAIEAQQDFLIPQTISSGFRTIVEMANLQKGATAGVVGGIGGTLVNFFAQNNELTHQKRMAEIEKEIANNQIDIAKLQQQISQNRIEYLEQKLQFLNNKRLNADLYYMLAEINEKRAERQLEGAIFMAYLFERALAFFLGEPDIRHIQFDYLDRPGGIFDAAQALDEAFGLVKGELAKVGPDKFDFFTETVSLRESYPLQFHRFLQTGTMRFAYSLYQFSKRRPASHQCRLREVGVELDGLVPVTGFSGTLTHTGRFLVRDRGSTLGPETTRLVPTDAQLEEALEAQRKQGSPVAAVGGVLYYNLPPDTKELSLNTQFVSPFPPNLVTLNIFEGHGPTGLWTLHIEEHGQLRIADIRLHFAIVARESHPEDLRPRVKELIRAYETELADGDLLDRISVFSLRQQFPNTFFALQSGPATLNLDEASFESGLTNLQFKMVIAQALDQEGKGLPGIGLEISRPEFGFNQARVTRTDGFSEDLDVAPQARDRDQRFPVVGAWQVRLSDPTQFSQLSDLNLFFMYAFEEVEEV